MEHGCQIAKFDPLLSLNCARVEGGGGAQYKICCHGALEPDLARFGAVSSAPVH